MATDKPLPILRGEKIWLRASEKADFTTGVEWIGDRDTAHFLGLKSPISVDGAAEFAQMVLAQQGKTVFSFSICRLEDDRSIGNVTLRNIDRENGGAELAIVIADKPLQGRGYGTDALNCVLDFGFGELRLERIELHVFDYNPRAIRSYEKAGFRTDVVMRRARFHRGAHHDVFQMSILRADWAALPRSRAWDYA